MFPILLNESLRVLYGNITHNWEILMCRGLESKLRSESPKTYSNRISVQSRKPYPMPSSGTVRSTTTQPDKRDHDHSSIIYKGTCK